MATVTFYRAWNTGDVNDIDISNGTCRFFIFAWGGKVLGNGGIGKHSHKDWPGIRQCFQYNTGTCVIQQVILIFIR